MKKLFIILLASLLLSSPFILAQWTDELNQDLSAYYRLDESSGNALDATPFGRNGTIYNATIQNSYGLIRTAYRFNSDLSSFVNVPFTGVSTDNNFSYSAWVYVNSTKTSSSAIFSESNNASGISFNYMRLDGVREIRSQMRDDTGANGVINSGVTPVDNTWNHVVYTGDGSTLRLYVNGALASSVGFAGSPLTFHTANIGAMWRADVGEYFNGTIDEVGVWNTNLNLTQIQQLYRSGLGITYNGTAPIFTIVPANASVAHNTPVSVTFKAVEGADLFDTYRDNSAFFVINDSGTLRNASALSAGVYQVLVTANTSQGFETSVAYQVTVTQGVGTCSLTVNPVSPIPYQTPVNVSGTCTTGVSNFTRNGVDVSATRGVFVTLAPGNYNYTIYGTAGGNSTAGIASTIITVQDAQPITDICEQSDITWTEATSIAGILFTIVLVGVVLVVLVGAVSGAIQVDRLGGMITLESLPGVIVLIGLTFLVIATMSFLIAGNVCVAFGA